MNHLTIAGQIKSTIRNVAAEAYYTSGQFLTRLQGKVLILTYHRVLSKREIDHHFIQPGIYVQDDVFERQMEFLKEHFSILSFSELLNLWSKKVFEKDRRYAVITFDDGWKDNFIYAFPILKKYSIPATIFLPTALIGTGQWFWPDKIGYIMRHHDITPFLYQRYPWMKRLKGKGYVEKIDSTIEICKDLSEEEIHDFILQISKDLNLIFPGDRMLVNWEEIEEMSQNGISFGSHSCTHRILTKLPAGDSQKEIEDSFRTLQERIINSIPVFCYPNGNYNREMIKLVKAAGYQAAVSTRFGFEGGSPEDLFCLKRISIHNDITATIPLFAFHISGMNHILKNQ